MTIPAFDTALSLLSKSKDPYLDIIRSGAYWIPLQFVYVEMCRNKDLVRLSELPVSEKNKYWEMVKYQQWNKWKKITVAQSLYTWDFIKSQNPHFII